jgi:uncharacterized membrane protein YqgA involved in biofilm formation
MSLKDKIRDWIICVLAFIIIVFAILLFPLAAAVICVLSLIIFVFCIPFGLLAGLEEGVEQLKKKIKSKRKVD